MIAELRDHLEAQAQASSSASTSASGPSTGKEEMAGSPPGLTPATPKTPGGGGNAFSSAAPAAARAPPSQLLAWSFPAVCVLQSDIVGVTKLGSRISAEALCSFLHDLFSTFDEFCEELGCLKIEASAFPLCEGTAVCAQ